MRMFSPNNLLRNHFHQKDYDRIDTRIHNKSSTNTSTNNTLNSIRKDRCEKDQLALKKPNQFKPFLNESIGDDNEKIKSIAIQISSEHVDIKAQNKESKKLERSIDYDSTLTLFQERVSVGFIERKNKNSTENRSTGTGFLISKNQVLTNAHLVNNFLKQNEEELNREVVNENEVSDEQITFWLVKYKGTRREGQTTQRQETQYEKYNIIGLKVPKMYVESVKNKQVGYCPSSDFAILQLDRDVEIDIIPRDYSSSPFNKDQTFQLLGFPTQISPDKYQLGPHKEIYRCKCRIKQIDTSQNLFYHGGCTSQGSSGSPLILQEANGKLVIKGIHCGFDPTKKVNFGIYFDKDYFSKSEMITIFGRQSSLDFFINSWEVSDQKSIASISQKSRSCGEIVPKYQKILVDNSNRMEIQNCINFTFSPNIISKRFKEQIDDNHKIKQIDYPQSPENESDQNKGLLDKPKKPSQKKSICDVICRYFCCFKG